MPGLFVGPASLPIIPMASRVLASEILRAVRVRRGENQWLALCATSLIAFVMF